MAVWKLPRATSVERLTVTPAQGEILYDTTSNKLYLGNGATAGGVEVSGGGGGGGSSEPDYQSDWFVIERTNIPPSNWTSGDVTTLTHSLGTSCPRIQIFAQCIADQIDNTIADSVEVSGGGVSANQIVAGQIYTLHSNANPYWDLNLSGGPNSDPNYCGLFHTFTTTNAMKIAAGNQGIFKIDNVMSAYGQQVYRCYIKVCLWDIGVSATI